MNNIQLKVKLVSINTKFDGQSAKVSGQAKFQYYNNGKVNTDTIGYQAFGKSALALVEAGVNSVHVVIGQLNVFPPSEQNPNHSMLLTLSQCLPVAVTKAPVAKPANPQPTAQPQPVEESSVDSLDKIPF